MTLYQARKLACEWHAGEGTPLYQFASTGQITDPAALVDEIDDCLSCAHWSTYKRAEDRATTLGALRALKAYVTS